jgi:hypothetical protein
MFELLLLGLLVFAVAAGFAVLLTIGVVLKLFLRLVLLPLLLIKWLIGGLMLLVVGPLLALIGIVLMLVLGAVFAIPLLPFALLVLFVWLLVRAASRPAVA